VARISKSELGKKNKRLAIFLGVVAGAFYLGFVLMHSF